MEKEERTHSRRQEERHARHTCSTEKRNIMHDTICREEIRRGMDTDTKRIHLRIKGQQQVREID